MTTPSVCTNFIQLGSVVTNCKNELKGEQLAVGRDSWPLSAGPSRMFSVATEGCHVGCSYVWFTVLTGSRIRPLFSDTWEICLL